MGRMRFVLYCALVMLLSACKPHTAQSGFSSLLVQEGKTVTSPANLQFPQDHLAHPDYGIEWWYLTANLENENADAIWLQWTLFRIKNQGGKVNVSKSQQSTNSWTDGQFYMAHFSLHTQQQHLSREVFASGGVGNAGVDEHSVKINNWRLNKSSSGLPSGLTLSFFDKKTATEVSIDLALDTAPDYLLQGDEGYSLKHPDTHLASYYYSLPKIRVTGSISFGEEAKVSAVTSVKTHKVTGQAWYDHEWSSMFLSDDFSGWSWFSIHLDGGAKLTLFSLEPVQVTSSRQEQFQKAWYGAIMAPDGSVIKLTDKQIQVIETHWQDTRIGNLPTQWQIAIPELSLDLKVTVRKSQQIAPFSIPYYEGAITVVGSKTGTGFVELTR